MDRVIVAFETEKTVQRVCETLTVAGIPVRSTCHTASEVIRNVRFMGGGVVVCGAKLPDATADQLTYDLDALACVLVVAKPEQLDFCENPHLFRLSLPINASALAASVRMLSQLSEMNLSAQKPDADERQIIERAKALLQATHGITEPEAHRYLQNQSMKTREKMANVAARIICEEESI